MANATDNVKKGIVRNLDEFIERGVETLTVDTRFWPNAMIGVDDTGYYAKFDDTQSMVFAGVVTQNDGAPLLPASTAGDGTAKLRIQQPKFFGLDITSIAVTDIGKKVYASFDQTGILANTGTYGNLIGIVEEILATGIALIRPNYWGVVGHRLFGASRTMAPTGNQVISKMDLNKTIFCANTATLTLTLPAVADTQAGDELIFIKSHASDTNAITLDGSGAETIDGSATLATMDAPFDTACLVSTGAAWIVKYRDIA